MTAELRAALGLLGAGAPALEAVQRAAGGVRSGRERLALGVAWFLCRRPEAAARQLEAAQQDGDRRVRVLAARLRAELLGVLGWNHEARDALERWLAEEPTSKAARRRLVDLLARSRAWEDVEAVVATPGELPLRRAAVLRERGRFDEARRELMALARPEMDESKRRRLADLLARAGAVTEARELLSEAQSPEALADRSRLWLFAGRTSEARRAAAEALEAGATGDAAARARVTLGACVLLDGVERLTVEEPDHQAAQDALAALDAVVADRPRDGEARLWRAHAHAILGDHAAVLADVDAGLPAVGGFDLGGALLRHLVEQRAAEPTEHRIEALEELREGLERLGFSRTELAAAGTLEQLEAVFGEAFVRLGGNRSGFGTRRREDGSLTPLGPTVSPRSDARRTLELIRVCGPERVLERFDAVQARWPRSSMGVVHRGEVLLWMGRYDEAAAAFEESLRINRHTRWGWIGQLANESFRGDPERALRLGEEGVRVMGGYGPSHFVYRAEASWRLGRRGAAREDFAEALRIGPSRMGARLALTLLAAEEGDSALVARELPALRRSCGPMLAAAAEERDAGPEAVWGGEASAEALEPILRTAYDWMRGNRSSSCHTWVAPNGRVRMNEDAGDADPFERDRGDRVMQALALLGP